MIPKQGRSLNKMIYTYKHQQVKFPMYLTHDVLNLVEQT